MDLAERWCADRLLGWTDRYGADDPGVETAAFEPTARRALILRSAWCDATSGVIGRQPDEQSRSMECGRFAWGKALKHFGRAAARSVINLPDFGAL